MAALATGVYCPNDCDRIPITFDLTDADTVPYAFPPGKPVCPACRSANIEPFDAGRAHCWPCGAVWESTP